MNESVYENIIKGTKLKLLNANEQQNFYLSLEKKKKDINETYEYSLSKCIEFFPFWRGI